MDAKISRLYASRLELSIEVENGKVYEEGSSYDILSLACSIIEQVASSHLERPNIAVYIASELPWLEKEIKDIE